MFQRSIRSSLVSLALLVLTAFVAFGQDDLQRLLNAHDPQTNQTQEVERQADPQPAPAVGTGGTTPTATWDGIEDRLQALLTRLKKILATLRERSGGKGKEKGKDKDKGKDQGKDEDKTSGDDSNYVKKGTLNPKNFGYDARYQPVMDIAEKFAQVNQKYVLAAGHVWKGYTGLTDCSGFVGHFYQTLMAAAGVKPAFAKNSWYPTSTTYKTQHTKKISGAFPPTKPRDLIKPGDVFVLDKDGRAYGHTGIFIGYDRSGNPLIAHSTTTTIGSSAVRGNKGRTGVRIEPIPSYYRERWAGIYRINGTDQALDKLAKTGAK